MVELADIRTEDNNKGGKTETLQILYQVFFLLKVLFHPQNSDIFLNSKKWDIIWDLRKFLLISRLQN